MSKKMISSTGEKAEAPDAVDPLESLKVADLEPADADSGLIRADENGEFPDENTEPPEPETDADGNFVITEGGTAKVKLSFENFYALFEGAFAFPAQLDADYAPLAIQPEESDQARATAKLFYGWAERYASWILIDFDTRFAEYALAATFLWVKYKTFVLIQKDKRERRVEARDDKQAEADKMAEDAYSEAGMEPAVGGEYAS